MKEEIIAEAKEVLRQLQTTIDVLRTEIKIDEHGVVWFRPSPDVIKRYHLEHLLR